MASSNCTFDFSPQFPSLFSLLLLLLLAIDHEMVPDPFARAASAFHTTTNITLSALLHFKNSCIYSDPTKFLDAWNPHHTPSYCNWQGVQCSQGTHIVTSLTLSSNQLVGYLCPLLADFPQLSYLDVSGNSFYGDIPTELGKLTSLTHLNLSANNLEGRIPNSLANCTHLQYLDLSINSLSTEFPSFITTITSLVHLDLSANRITGQLPPMIGLLSNLQFFQASSADLNGSMPPSIANCTNLAWLDLSINGLSGHLPSGWSTLAAHLQYVNLERNNFIGTIPATLFNCTRLIHLQLDYNRLSGSIPQEIGELSQVQWLSFDGNSDLGGRILDTIASSLFNLSDLQILRLSSGGFSGTLPEQVKNLTALSEIRLDNNAFEGRIPEGLGELKSLKVIDLSKNSLYGTISFNFSPSTTSIDLSHNKLTGAVPSSWGIKLQVVLLSSNQFTGKIPASLGDNSQELYYLNLSINKLNGEIPKTFGNMGSLKYLDLSHNELSGALPVLLPSLLLVDFSFNALEGMIPNVQPYSSSSPKCFLGNPGLCGVPLSVSCEHVASSAHVAVFVSIALGAFVLAIFCVSFGWWHRARSKKYTNKYFMPQSIISWTPRDMREATDDFDGANVIGSGAMSVCYKGVMKDGRAVAVKTFDSIELEARESFVNELKTLGQVKHRNLVKVLGYCVAKEEVALVMEFMELGDLDENLHSPHKCLLWKDRVNVAIDVAEGLIYLHHEYVQPIIHCDLKPRNILLGSDMVAKVSDFGIAMLLDKDQSKGFSTSNFKGTFGYIAPEFASGSRISTKADVYSYGVLLMELVTGVSPTSEKLPGVTLHEWTRTFYNSRRTNEVLDKVLQESTATIVKEAEVLLGIGLRCSSEWPKERPTMKDVRKLLSSIRNQNVVHYPKLQQILQA